MPEDLEYRYLQQEQRQLQRKYKEDIKGGHTNPDISQLRDLTDSGAHRLRGTLGIKPIIKI